MNSLFKKFTRNNSQVKASHYDFSKATIESSMNSKMHSLKSSLIAE